MNVSEVESDFIATGLHGIMVSACAYACFKSAVFIDGGGI